ncbi:hypothetical protein HanPSC8_Chr05g0189951 [Helianthus annuus]|nr:hypothetical protein HanPSC8_Chr05g0189951 [Helianthus annuus]
MAVPTVPLLSPHVVNLPVFPSTSPRVTAAIQTVLIRWSHLFEAVSKDGSDCCSAERFSFFLPYGGLIESRQKLSQGILAEIWLQAVVPRFWML